MPVKTRQGWIAPKPEGCRYEVNGEHPSGVFVQHIPRAITSLEYAGSGADAGEGFELPSDAAFLRDIAAAINRVADEIEKGR